MLIGAALSGLLAVCFAQTVVEPIAAPLPVLPAGSLAPLAVEPGPAPGASPTLELRPLETGLSLQPLADAGRGDPASSPPASASARASRWTEPLRAWASEGARAGSELAGLGGRLDRLFSGSSARPPLLSAPEGSDRGLARPSREAGRFVVNDEGVPIFGRAAEYYGEVTRLVAALQAKGADLSESLDVMDDSYGDVWAKLKAIEALAARGRVSDNNVHLPRTLTWVDGVLAAGGQRVAVHTHRVYFHPAEVASSEVGEGKRRVESFLRQAVRQFEKGGKAERELGGLDSVVLAFDARGYAELKAFLREKEAELAKSQPGRFKFEFVEELAAVPASREALRAELGALIRKYGAQAEGVGKIVEGVIYSRYVGLLLELRTIEHFLGLGWRILQSGRDLFDAKGQYVTELDTVVRSPEGKIYVVEAKSARVALPYEEALRSKVEYKLATYQKNRELLEKAVGGPFEVIFSVDVGPNLGLAPYLESARARLETAYGFKVGFLFLESVPTDGGPRLDGNERPRSRPPKGRNKRRRR